MRIEFCSLVSDLFETNSQDSLTISVLDVKMSLSMSPIVSLDNYLPSNKKDIEGFCGRWILKHKPLVTEPATGTTFPPFSHHLPYFVQRTDRINSLSIDQKTK